MKNYNEIERLKKEITNAIEEGYKIRRTDVKKINKSNLQDEYNLTPILQRQELNLALLDIFSRIEDENIDNLFDSILYVTFGANQDKEGELAKSIAELEKAEQELENLLSKKTDVNRNELTKAITEDKEKAINIVKKQKKSKEYKEERIAKIEDQYNGYLKNNSAYIKKLKHDLANLNQKLGKTEDDDKQDKLEERISELNNKIIRLNNIVINDGLDVKIAEAEELVARRRKEVESKSNMEESEFEKRTSRENRIKAHEDGLTFKRTFTNKDGEVLEIVEHFEYWMRSSSQSRTGTEQYFRTSKIVINKVTGEIVEKIDNSKLFEEHNKWLNLNMNLEEQGAVELGAYNSLVSSKLETIVQIDAKKHILIIPDVAKNITELGYVNSYDEENKCIKTELKETTFVNNLFDGQSIGSKEFFEQDLRDRSGSSQLFRQRFTKFNCVSVDFQYEWRRQFEEDKKNGKYPKDMKYEDLEVRNIDGRMVKACEVKIITTPSAIKLNKITMRDENGKIMTTIEKLSKWFDICQEDDNVFGIVKEEHSAKVTDLLSDQSATITNEIQQSSYQHISSLQYEDGLGEKIFNAYEKDIIEQMKTNPSFFADFLEKNANDMNDYKHHLNLMKINANYCKTVEYQDYLNNVLREYESKLKRGSIKVSGSYHTILMNPELMVDMAYKPDEFKKQCKEDEEGLVKYTLKDDFVSDEYGEYQISVKDENGEVIRDEDGKIIKEEINGVKFYSKGMACGEECGLFRNPHNTPSNIGYGVNCCNPQANNRLARLFKNISANVVVIDGLRYSIQDTLNGSDQDSDTVLVTNNKSMMLNGKTRKERGYYTVKTDSSLNAETNVNRNAKQHMAIVNDKLKSAKTNIGEVSNTGELVMSQLYEIEYQLNREDLDEALDRLSADEDYKELRKLIEKIDSLEKELGLREAKIKADIEAKQDKQKEELEELAELNKELKEKMKDEIKAEKEKQKEILKQTAKEQKKQLREKFKAENKAKEDKLKEELAEQKKALKEKLEDEIKIYKAESNKELTEKMKEIDKIKDEVIIKVDIVADKHESLNKWIVMQDTKIIKEQKEELKKELKIQLSKTSSLGNMAIDGVKREFKVSVSTELKKIMDVLMKDINNKAYAPLFFEKCGVKANLPNFRMHNVMDDIVNLNMGTRVKREATERLETIFDFSILEENKYKKHVDNKTREYAWDKIIEAHNKIENVRASLSNAKDLDDRKALELTITEIKEALIRDLHDFGMVDEEGNVISNKNGKAKTFNVNKSTRYKILQDCIKPADNVVNKQLKRACFKLVAEVFKEEMAMVLKKGEGVTPFSKRQKRAEQIEKEVFDMAMKQCNSYRNDVEDLAKQTIKIMREQLSDISNGEFDDKIKDILKGHEEKLTEIRNKINIDGVVEHAYNKTLYNFSKDIGVAIDFNKINPKTVKAILTEPLHNKTFDERLDNSVKRYENEFKAILLNMQLQGMSIQQAVNLFNEQTEHNVKGVEMIIRTQVTYYSNLSQAEAIKELGAKKFVFVATLDSRTSTICAEKDGKIFSVDDKENLPPLHPNCRSTIISYWDDELLDKNRNRIAKDKNNEWINVGNITYKEYAEKYLK